MISKKLKRCAKIICPLLIDTGKDISCPNMKKQLTEMSKEECIIDECEWLGDCWGVDNV